MSASHNDLRCASAALDLGHWTALFEIRSKCIWTSVRAEEEYFNVAYDGGSETPPIWQEAVNRLTQTTRMLCQLAPGLESLTAKYDALLKRTWTGLERYYLGREHREQVRGDEAGHYFGVLELPPWTELGWPELTKSTRNLVEHLPPLAQTCFNAASLLCSAPEATYVLELADPLLVNFQSARPTTATPVQFLHWVNVVLGGLFWLRGTATR